MYSGISEGHLFPDLAWDQFSKAFLDRFMAYSLRDQTRDEFDHLELGFMNIIEYDKSFHSLFRYFICNTASKSEKIQKFIKGLDVLL